MARRQYLSSLSVFSKFHRRCVDQSANCVPQNRFPCLNDTKILTEQLDSLFEQTTASHIAEVWVCVFSAPAHDYALRVVGETKYENVRLVTSDFNFKFYGRFQVRQSPKLVLRRFGRVAVLRCVVLRRSV